VKRIARRSVGAGQGVPERLEHEARPDATERRWSEEENPETFPARLVESPVVLATGRHEGWRQGRRVAASADRRLS